MSILDRWDERQAAEEDAIKPYETMTLGASLAFAGVNECDTTSALARLASEHSAKAESFYSATRRVQSDFKFEGGILNFRSAVATETENNDIVHAKVHEAKNRRNAVVILPHLNAPMWPYGSICKYLVQFGITAVELCMPYHGVRNRPGARTSDYFLSANLGRTIRSVRQAVTDTKGVIDWLAERGYENLGVIGLSLGSCVGGLVGAHDRRVRASAMLLTAGDFGEVVWTGRATKHIKAALAAGITLEELRQVWSIISTGTFTEELSRPGHKILILSGSRDRAVAPYLTRRFVDQLKDRGAQLTWHVLPCGHYSLALFPFNALAFLALIRFFRAAGFLK